MVNYPLYCGICQVWRGFVGRVWGKGGHCLRIVHSLLPWWQVERSTDMLYYRINIILILLILSIP